MYNHGFILIAVLWVTMILSIFALNFSTTSRLEGIQTLNTEQRVKETQLLRSALELGYHEYLKYKENKSLLEKKEQIEKITGQPLSLWFPRYEPFTATIGEKKIAIRVQNDQGKININQIKLDLLQEIIATCGVKEGSRMTTIANSILDWIDSDNLHRPEGAEKEFYLAKSEPYLPKNHQIENIHELLLVQEVDPDLFYGNQDHPGLVDYFSVNGKNNQLDINTASPQSFALMENIPKEAVEEIIALRREKPISKISDLSMVIPQKHFSTLTEHFYVAKSVLPRIEAAMVLDDGKLGRKIKKVFYKNES